MLYSRTVDNRSQDVKIGRSNNSGLPPQASHSNRTSRLLVSTAAALLVLASCGFGVLFAWQVGSKHDVLLGIISVAMALGLEVAKPFAIDGAFRSLRELRVVQAAALTLVGALAIGYSLQAELTFMSMTRGDMVAERASAHRRPWRGEPPYRREPLLRSSARLAGCS